MSATLHRSLIAFALLGSATAAAQQPSAPAPPAASSAEGERLRLLEEEVTRLRAEMDAARGKASPAPEAELAAEPPPEEPERGLDIYGFFDASFYKLFGLEQKAGETHALRPYLHDKSSFAIGNFNLYVDMHAEKDWRFLGEVRFTLAPMGTEDATTQRRTDVPFRRTDTNVQEPGNNENFTHRWSGIVLERAHVEYAPRDWFKVLGGIFLTPYGIWNVDHGSPVVIPARVPFAVRKQLFPERQAGLQLSGSFFPGGVQLGYFLTLSNGKGLTSLHQDLDENKALGGRFFAALSGELTGQVGFSYYTGRFTDTTKDYSSVVGILRVDDEIISRYWELAVAFDWQAAYKGFDFRGEYIRARRWYSDVFRPNEDAACTGAVCRKQADFSDWATYLLVSYELPIKDLKLRPYALWEYTPQDDTNETDDVMVSYFGVNWRITPRAILKAEYVFVTFTNDLADLFRDAPQTVRDQVGRIDRDSQAVRVQWTYAF